MKTKAIHIVSFDNPYPPNYGGVIDVFFKIKALNELGYDIYLHYFSKNDIDKNDELKKYVKEIYHYKKKPSIITFFTLLPWSVASRYNKKLAYNLNKTKAPILFEGLQTSAVVFRDKLNNKILLRLHNLENNYYSGLYKSEKNLIKKTLFWLESKKYQKYQSILSKFDAVITLSNFENEYIKQNFKNESYIPVFHGNENISNLSEYGEYALYHGDLRTSDNKKAVEFLIEIFKKIPDYKLKIASSVGKNWVESKCKSYDNISFVFIKNQNHLEDLLSKAHINVMYSFQESGTKLKVINALFKSRFCIINKNMVDDANILNLCSLAENEAVYIDTINKLKNQPYLEFSNRKTVLEHHLNDRNNAELLSKLIEK